MQRAAVCGKHQTVFAADFAEGQAAADDFQADSVFFQVDAAEVRIGQADIAAEFVVGFLAASDRGLLFGDGDGIPFFQIVQVFLQQDIAAARIGFSFGDDGDFADIFIALRVFRAVDETVQSAILIQAQTVFFGRDAYAVAERAQNGLGKRVGGVLAEGLDVDGHIVLRGRRKPVAHFGEGFDFTAFVRMSECCPGFAAEGDGQTQNIVRKAGFQGS
ncbi:Uncharacterised protein [Neisseria meningitidis]|nr:Uncharacterised protein [Neisseria meningitidis]